MERVAGHTVLINAAAGFAVVGGRYHSDQQDLDGAKSRVRFYRSLAEPSDPKRRRFAHFYVGKLAAWQRAVQLLQGGA